MSCLLLLALSAACGSASALPWTPSPESQAGFLSFPIVERRSVSALRRRDDTATLYNHTNVAYMIELDIGTPSQKVQVQLDTGSQELWLNPDCTTVDDIESESFCESLSVYTPSSSSTFKNNMTHTELAYGKGTANIEYVQDNIVVPGTNNSVLHNVSFGVATSSSNAAVPILGVSFGNGYNLDYNNLIDELALQGVTNGRAFSLALGGGAPTDNGKDPVSSTISNGFVIFGGVDTKKFAGPLYQFANLPPQAGDQGRPWRYWVQLDSVGFTSPGSKSSSKYSGSSMPIVLDSGSTLSYLPQTVINSLAKSFGVSQSQVDQQGAIVVDCNYGSKGGSVDFAFGPLTVSVPLSDFIFEVQPGLCAVGAIASDDGTGTTVGSTALLGDTFLRLAYAVFDQDNKHIYLAQAANCGQNEQTLPAGGNYNFTGECSLAAGKSTSAAAGLSAPSLSTSLLVAFVGLQAAMALL